jgi:hypothetical protein
MNPGMAEEAGKVASTTVTALASTPAVLALVIFNLMFMAMSVYVVMKSTERWNAEIDRWEKLVHACQDIPGRKDP